MQLSTSLKPHYNYNYKNAAAECMQLSQLLNLIMIHDFWDFIEIRRDPPGFCFYH